jgi:hypothetical protein
MAQYNARQGTRRKPDADHPWPAQFLPHYLARANRDQCGGAADEKSPPAQQQHIGHSARRAAAAATRCV